MSAPRALESWRNASALAAAQKGGRGNVRLARWCAVFVLLLVLVVGAPVAYAAGVPTGLVVWEVAKDGAAYDVTLHWAPVAGALTYKTQLGGVAAGSGLEVCEYVFEDVPAGEAVFGVCSTDGVGDSVYTTLTVTYGGLAGGIGSIVAGIGDVATEWMTEGGLMLYVVGFAVVAFIWRRVARAIRR